MSRLSPISWKQFVQRMHDLGFDGPDVDGKHPQMRRENIGMIIPNPHDGDMVLDSWGACCGKRV